VFFVTELISVPLRGAHACLTLGLLQTTDACSVVMPLTLDCIFRDFADIFRGIGFMPRNTIYNFTTALLVLFSRHGKYFTLFSPG